MLQKQTIDFLNTYKSHMLKVQVELVSFKKKVSEHYQNMRKDARVQQLEKMNLFLQTESLDLAAKVENYKTQE